MTRKRSTVNVPEELVEEILSRVPAASVARFRLTSKPLNALIKDGKFVKKHSDNAPRESLTIMLVGYTLCRVSFRLRGTYDDEVVPSAKVTSVFSLADPLSSTSNEVKIRNVFHCEGLLLCNTVDKRLVVWNPCSGETRWIQPIKSYKQSDVYGLGFDGKSSGYKILRMDEIRHPNKTVIELYDFASNSWRNLGVATDWFIPVRGSCGMSVRGNGYWLASTQETPNHEFLLNFDFSAEGFRTSSLPNVFPHCGLDLSVVGEEQFCLLVTKPVHIEVWLGTKIDSTGTMSWNKFLTARGDDKFVPWRTYFAAGDWNKVVVYREQDDVLKSILHIVAEGRYIQAARLTVRSYCGLLINYVPSLVPIPKGI